MPERTLTWPLVGRASELAQIVEAQAAGLPGVVVAGGAGVGKSRLARSAVDDAGARGAFTAWVRGASSAATIPFAAFAGLLPDAAPGADRLAFIRAVETSLRAQADGRPTVLGVDDAQHLDDASAGLLLHLVDRGAAFVVATIRSGGAVPDAVTALWKDAGARRLDLEPFGRAELAELVETALDGPVEHSAQHWIWESSAGNVLYAQQLVSGALDSGALARLEELWCLSGHPTPSPSLTDLVSARMGSLTEAQRDALELLALGEPLSLRDAEALIDPATLDAFEAQELVEIEPPTQGGAVRIAHPLFTELVIAEMPVSRGRRQRLRLAELIGKRESRSSDDSLRIACWLLDAGETVPTATLVEAAWAASLAGSELGSRFAQMALDAGAGADASMVLARAHGIHGRDAEAEAVLAAVETPWEDPALAFDYLRLRAGGLVWGLDRGRDALDLLDRAAGWWPDAAWRRRIAAMRLQFAVLVEPPGTLAPQIEELVADESLDELARRRARRTLAADRLWVGRVGEARELMRAIRPQIPLRSEQDGIELATRSAVGLASGDDLPGLAAEMRAVFDAAVEHADPAAAGLAAFTVAAVDYLAGRFLDAQRWLAEAAAEAGRQDPFRTLILVRSLQIGVSEALGAHGAAAVAGMRAEEELAAHALQRAVRSWFARGRGWTALAAGDPWRAQQLLTDAAAQLDWAPVFAAELLYEALRAGAPPRTIAWPLDALRGRSDAPLTQAFAAHAAARAGDDGPGLIAVSETFEQLAALRYAAEAAAQAATAFAAAGRQDSARRAAARSRDLQPQGQGAAPIAIHGVDHDAIELTPREAQLVELAARGMTNAEIAERLVVSVRTVETHIYRAMQKLGISDRRDFRSSSPPGAPKDQ